MKKITTTILPILILAFLIGCGPANPGEFEPHTGKDSLSMAFFDEAPPKDAFENQPITLSVILQNLGAEDITNGVLTISTDRNLIEKEVSTFNFNLAGKVTLIDTKGDQQFFTSKATTKTIQGLTKQDTTVRATACYDHKTIFGEDVCINTDIFNQEDKPNICKRKTLSFPQGQGASISVRSVEQLWLPAQSGEGIIPQYTIEIENEGKGIAIKQGLSQQACSSQGVTKNNIGVIDVTTVILGSQQLECSNKDLSVERIERNNEFYDIQRTKMVCKGQEIPITTKPYTTSLTVELDYGYIDFIETDINIKKLNTI